MEIIRISFLVALILLSHHCKSARILGLFQFHGKSHFDMFEALMKGLAERGHQVDVLSHFPQNTPIPGYTDLSVRGSIPSLVGNITIELVDRMSMLDSVKYMMAHGVQICDVILQTEVLQNLKKTKVKYDLVITEIFGSDCLLPFGHYFNVPTIGMVSSIPLPWVPDRFGYPDNPSSISNYFSSFVPPMNLLERVQNTLLTIIFKTYYYYYSILPTESRVRPFFGEDMPPLIDLINNISFCLFNSHYSMNGAQPTPPNVAEVGGLHIKPGRPLPQKYTNILESADQGVIYFSLGSMVMTESFSKQQQRALMDAFGELPYTVLWRANGSTFEGPLPKNIIFEPWMPQMEILCHPKTKLFISHGGLLGAQEAVYCGVPMINMPLFSDHFLYVKTFENMGINVKINHRTLSKQIILAAIREIFENPKYTENIKIKSKQFRQRPLSAMETAIFWVEYVIEHKGALHLRPAGVDLAWYQLYLFDVTTVLIIAVTFIILILYIFINFAISTYCGHPVRENKSTKQKYN